MTGPHSLAVVLAAAALASIVRLVVAHRRAAPGTRPALWRTGALAALTLLSTWLLYRTLDPPRVAVPGDTMVVLTARADGLAVPDARLRVALPEASGAPADAVRMPDLATALRRHPEVRTLVVVGAGLEARDRDAVGARALTFVPAPLPSGIVALDAPRHVAPGERFAVHGRITGFEAAQVALSDPAGRIVDVAQADADGAFRLAATARGAGATLFSVALQDVEASPATRVALPLVVDPATPPRVLLLAATPNPDLRALRRWAENTGLPLRWRAALGGGAAVGDAPALDAAALAEQDLVVIEARALEALGPAGRRILAQAVADGLGVLVHAPDGPSSAVRSWLRSAGLAVTAGRARPWRPDPGPADAARLRAWAGPGSDDAPFDPLLAGEAPAAARYHPLDGGLSISGPAAADAMRWQRWGRGRLGVTTLADSWQWPLAGRADLHADVWSAWARSLARPHEHAAPVFEAESRVGTRAVVCGVADGTGVRAPDGRTWPLVRDPAARDCAGLWPEVSGWHRLDDDDAHALWVRDADEAPGLQAAALAQATEALVRATPGTSSPTATRPGQPLPWFLAWLAATAALWALGRARRGRSPGTRPTG